MHKSHEDKSHPLTPDLRAANRRSGRGQTQLHKVTVPIYDSCA